MMKLIPTLAILIVNFMLPQEKCDKYKTALDYLYNSNIVRDFIKEQVRDELGGIVVGKDFIKFNLNSLDEDVIKKDYLHDYSLFSSRNMSLNEKRIENWVIDSLSIQSGKINDSLSQISQEKCYQLDQKGSCRNAIVFFSKLYFDRIYIEIMPLSRATKLEDSTVNSVFDQGEVLTFLLVFKNNQVVKSYTGKISRN